MGIEMQRIGERQGFVMQGVDVTVKPATGSAYLGAQGQPAGGAQDGDGPGNGGAGGHIGQPADGVVAGKRRIATGLAGREHNDHPHQLVDRFEYRIFDHRGWKRVVPVPEEDHAVRRTLAG